MSRDGVSSRTRFPNRLKYERELRGWSQGKLAEELGTSVVTVSSWERGVALPSPYYRQQLFNVLGKNAQDLDLLQPINGQQNHASEDAEDRAIRPHPPAYSNRHRLLQKVEAFWIKGVLEPSLHDAPLLSLTLQAEPRAVKTPWRRLAVSASTPSLLPANTSLIDVYDQAGGELLLLGEPGAGKTTLLLSLLRKLIGRAEHDEQHPLPVVFHLASWTKAHTSLAEWLIEELHQTYQVPRMLSRTWIISDQILPLLDGLDEVAKTDRPACVEAINAYRRDHGLTPMVVCSRTQTYRALPKRLLMQQAVVIQPLSTEQIETYLSDSHAHLVDARALIRQDQILQEFASNPLMLNILTLSVREQFNNDLLATLPPDRQQQHVFAVYIKHMLEQRAKQPMYASNQLMHWLGWLAKQLSLHAQAEFYLERLQPDWLPEHGWYRSMYRVLMRMSFGLIFGVMMGLAFYVIVSLSDDDRYSLSALLMIVGVGSVAGVIFGLLDPYARDGQVQHVIRWSKAQLRRGCIAFLIFGLIFGIIGGLRTSPQNGVLLALIAGFLAMLMGGLGLVTRPQGEILPTEIMTWSWTSMWQSLRKQAGKGAGVGLLTGIATAFIFSLASHLGMGTTIGLASHLGVGATIGLAYGLTTWSVIWLVGGFAGGLSQDRIPEQKRVRPNEGMWRSAMNSIRFGLVVGLITIMAFGGAIVLVTWLIGGIVQVVGPLDFVEVDNSVDGLLQVLLLSIPLATMAGLGLAIDRGGGACLQHIILRLLLWWAGYLPWRIARVLDYATERLLLRNVGGGYIFVHRLVQEYIASQSYSSNSH